METSGKSMRKKVGRSRGEFDIGTFLSKHVGTEAIEKPVQYTMGEVSVLVEMASRVLLADASLLELRPPISVAGNINGQYRDLLAAICAGGYPPGIAASWLFLGDYVSRGSRSVECLCFLLALKVKFPAHIFLLRGHHEDRDTAEQYGFKADCERKLKASNAWEMFTPVFEAMPFAAIIGEPPRRFFAVHGGIGGPDTKLADILALRRPSVLPRYGLAADLVWADLDTLTETYADSLRGISHRFGRKALNKFCTLNDIALVIRSHQMVQEGFQFFGSQLVTLWTAPNYNAEFNNMGAVAVINAESAICFKLLVAEPGDEDDEGGPANVTVPAQSVAATSEHASQVAQGSKGDGPASAATPKSPA